jgi:hypothetical protein
MATPHTLEKIVSGGQTGVDRAALDAALDAGFPCGGWCPRGRRAEGGPIDPRYPLSETPWDGYPQRTEWNVRDSDGTLVLTHGEPDRGTALTIDLAGKRGKPCLVLDLAGEPDYQQLLAWINANKIKVLNVAGPRESSRPGMYQLARVFLARLFGGDS